MELNNNLNVGLRKEKFWSTINKTKGFEREFWIGEMKVSTDMDNVMFLSTNAPPNNFEAEGLRGFFKEDSLILTFDFDRFLNLPGEGSPAIKMLKALDAVLATAGIGIKDWDRFLEDEVAYNLKVYLSPKDRKLLFDLLDKKRAKINEGSKKAILYSYNFPSLGTMLEFKADPSDMGNLVHVIVKILDHRCHQYMSGFIQFCCLSLEEAADILNREVGPFFRSTESFEPESKWFNLMEIASGLKPRETAEIAIEKILSIHKYSPAKPDYGSVDLYEDFVGESLDSILSKSTAWLKESENLRYEIQQTLRFLKRHERIIRNLAEKFEIRRVGSVEEFLKRDENEDDI
ncbi:hypothetical protein [Leptospira borgpetersenii]|uniref:Uncharacterized protein n=1 Tax=Leptospira borgpetersenii serovar Ballum TaxID=280505 RepID=A0A0E3B5S9_LEPBO|nr:hypothetical protein [Leptospira borgpetersenii]EMO07878.1 hypothetical protein LEP1GSC137_1689 [Leptospira borgpetersenii str. Noumea 25]ALO25289.1 hypothetical protein LBBP_00975 [Leptospira borgpetersenii serovar Ballum]ANH00240.1 Uncharacterized protein LB4E_0775 [Leptospira borgpetersenii str. 4E]EKQ98223.1 hypothetical protein LEP1GSC121_3303 [Leptospira borgpetersenii serovar Castellonis str. 200801910]KGE22854.1 hypothetical protein IQ66_14280 [Leptospira borgpetersenii serovar Ball